MYTMEEAGLWMMRRGAEQLAHQMETDQGANSNATKTLINNLIFAESKSYRTSTIILAAFNVCAALVTAFSILYDCYWTSKRCSPENRAEKFCVSKIHPAETFPLVLALGIAIQGTVFAGAQSVGLKSIYVDSCGTVGQLVFPAIFLVPYIQIVFGLECTIRSFRALPFQARRKYDVTICLITVALMTIGTWIPTHINPETNICNASLVWFIARYGVEGLVLLSVVAVLSIISAIIIFCKVSTSDLIDEHQRIAASRMVYYMTLAVIPLAFVIPWFVTLTLESPTIITSMMATVVLNLSGLMNGALHIFLRSNTAATSFGPKGSSGWNKRKHEIRIWGPNELGFDGHLLQPVSGPRPESQASFHKEKHLSLDSVISPHYQYVKTSGFPQQNSFPLVATPTKSRDADFPGSASTTSPSRRQRKQSQTYSLFPTETLVTSPGTGQLPATTFSPKPRSPASPILNVPTSVFATRGADEVGDGLESIYIANEISLAPPPDVFVNKSRHMRNSSLVSSATVQIGLRLSHAVPDETPSLPSTTYKLNARPTEIARSSTRSPTPLQIQTQNLSPIRPPPRSPFRPTPLLNSNFNAIATAEDRPGLLRSGPIDKAERDARMKTLPPVPRMQSTVSKLSMESGEEIQIQLSPAVYTPGSVSPKTVVTDSGNEKETDAEGSKDIKRSQSARKVGLPSRPGPSSPRDVLISAPVAKNPLALNAPIPKPLQVRRQTGKRDWI